MLLNILSGFAWFFDDILEGFGQIENRHISGGASDDTDNKRSEHNKCCNDAILHFDVFCRKGKDLVQVLILFSFSLFTQSADNPADKNSAYDHITKNDEYAASHYRYGSDKKHSQQNGDRYKHQN